MTSPGSGFRLENESKKNAIRSLCRALACGVALAAVAPLQADNWPRFRGPNGEGKSDLKGLPAAWTPEDYEWVIDLPGKGHSSPVVWEDLLYVTSSSAEGVRTIHCLDALTGEARWSDAVQLGTPRLHKKNSHASGTPALDAERVYVAFADAEHYLVKAYSHRGEKLWTKDLGSFTSQHGPGVSPILYENLVIVPNDQMGPSQIVALDARTGEQVWTTSDRRYDRASYATPMILEVGGSDQIICLSGAVGLAGLDPHTGEELWASGELPQRTVASPVFGNGLLVATCGGGGIGKYLIAVDPNGRGDVSRSHVKGDRSQNLPYVPTPIIRDNYLYMWNDNGVVCCTDLSGDLKENVWRERIGGNYSGSPVLIDDKIYCISEDGDVVVIDASPEFRLHGKSPLGDTSYATPAVANGRLYLRGFSKLASLKAKETSVPLSE